MFKGKLIQGDCLTVLKSLADNSIDCVVTSPPYNLGGDFHACKKGKDGKSIRTSYGGYNSFNDSLPEEDYQKNQILVLNELFRITKQNSFCFYVHKERIKNNEIISPLYWITKTNWKVFQCVILDQKSTANVDKKRFFPTYEVIYILCKNKESRLNNFDCLTSVWQLEKVNRKIAQHPASFSEELPIRCIKAATQPNDVVLDCYMGTGTTGVACKLLDRQFLGIEIDKNYFEISKQRINESCSQLTLFDITDKGE